ncbi:MAG TPA: SusC/RagA family TonB-linked outer membrane protein [Gemmatimonadaceae bacterium]|nr:SusC/RagA family TonB-linked outer membrane protein [Gemmatimonadaceae bacterium]
MTSATRWAVALVLIPLLASSALAQRRLTGRVTDAASGEPLAGASITIAGTTAGTIANEQGAFSLAAPAGDVTILVRRIGYKRRSVPVTGDGEVAVGLERDVLQLETQVVTGVQSSVSRRNAANDVAQVSAEQIARVPAPSIENALAGKIAGAQVISNSGAPGGGNQVRLRGVTSIFGSADPLYVIDGVIVSNDVIQPGSNAISAARRQTSNASNQDNGVNRIADLNPNDVESVEVLKGASASAIYGSKASNGVIIIRTKSGAPGRTSLGITQRVGTFSLAKKFGARRFTLNEAIAYGSTRGFTAQQVTDNYNSCNGFCDYEEELFGENPLSYETSITARGGSENTTYFASALNKYDGGIQKNTGYRKQALRLNLGQAVGSRLTLNTNANLIRTLTRRGISNNDNANITPYFVLAATPSWFDMRPRDGVYPANPFAVTNSFQNVDRLQTPQEVYRLIGSVGASYSILNTDRQTLALRLDGGADRYNQQANIISPRDLFFEPNDGLPGTVTALSGRVLSANVNGSVQHTYANLAGLFSAATTLGVQREITQRRLDNIVTRDVILGQENVNRGAATEVFADRQEVRGLAFFVQEDLTTLDERALLSLGGRAERSTVNGDIDKYYFFPKAAASYRLPFALYSLDDIKLRVAVGQSGNQPLYIQKYSPTVIGVYDRQNGLQVGNVRGDPDITPERQTEIEGGFDLTAFNQRASLSFTLYRRLLKDVILQIAAAPSQGYQVQIDNGGKFRTLGTDVMLQVEPIRGDDFGWISRTTFSMYRSKVLELPVPAFTVAQDAYGNNIAFGAGYGIARLEVGKSVTQIVASDVVNGEAIVRQKGDAAPNHTMGFSNDFNWKGLRLSSLFDWQSGGDLVNVTQNVFDAYGLAPDQADGGLARINLNDTQGISQYVYSASFVKLRELSLSYELPSYWTGRLFGGTSRGARLEVSGRNLATWTDYPGVDPEVSNFGSQQVSRFIDLAPFPPSRSVFFTLDVSF